MIPRSDSEVADMLREAEQLHAAILPALDGHCPAVIALVCIQTAAAVIALQPEHLRADQLRRALVMLADLSGVEG
jgi:hypothetical protein